MVFIDMTDWRAKLTDSMQPMEKSARVKMGSSFCTVLFCFLILWAEKSRVSAESTDQCLASGLFKGISAPVRRSPCGFTLTRLTLQKTI